MKKFRFVLQAPTGLKFFSNPAEYPSARDMLIVLQDGWLGDLGPSVTGIEELVGGKWVNVPLPQMVGVS